MGIWLYRNSWNKKIRKKLSKEQEKFTNIQKNIQEEIKNIQDNCVHEYYQTSTGMYEDSYRCKICGHEDWH